MNKNLDIGKKIKDIRQGKNLSQKRFGVKIGVSGKTVSAYEQGRCMPSLKILDSISQVYDVTFLHLKKSKKSQLKEKLKYIIKAVEDIENTFLSGKEE